jgi:hypothetical protein
VLLLVASVRVPHRVVNATCAPTHICVVQFLCGAIVVWWQLCEGRADEWPLNGTTAASKFISRAAIFRPSTLLLIGIHALVL